MCYDSCMGHDTIKTLYSNLLVTHSKPNNGFSVIEQSFDGTELNALCGPLLGEGWVTAEVAARIISTYLGLGEEAVPTFVQYCQQIANRRIDL